MIQLLKDTPDTELQEMLSSSVLDVKERLESLEITLLLDGKYDSLGAILEIHSGAGGTEACDWLFLDQGMPDPEERLSKTAAAQFLCLHT